MALYENTGSSYRIWPTLQSPDGHTLELQPGETVELDLPADFEDPYLQPVGAESAQSALVQADEAKLAADEAAEEGATA